MEADVGRYRRHTPYSDPGAFRDRWSVLSGRDAASAAEVARNLLYHYRADGIEVPIERRGDIDSRWSARILELDARRHPDAVDVPREKADRVAGCCRDYTLLTVSVLRENDVPARGRVGFAGYFGAEFHYDHVVTEWWDGTRWVRCDAQLEPTWFPFDTGDLSREGLDGFTSAAEVWAAIRRGDADPRTFGVFPQSPFSGTAFVFDYVIRDVAQLNGDELLLWDIWGGMRTGDDVPDDAAAWMDELAALVVSVDAGDAGAAARLAERYAADSRLAPRGRVRQASPYGLPAVEVDLAALAPSGVTRTLTG
jgi:hypothetical protein